MGICWSSKSVDQSPQTTGQLSSGTQTTTTTASNTTSSSSGSSGFWAASVSQSPRGQMLPNPNLRVFTFQELRAATRNFRSDTIVGEGGFGKVYKGWLDSKNGIVGSTTVVAVKKLNPESLQGLEEWQVFSFLFYFLFIIYIFFNSSFPITSK